MPDHDVPTHRQIPLNSDFTWSPKLDRPRFLRCRLRADLGFVNVGFNTADVAYSFYRHLMPGPWMTGTVRSLMESSAFYLELLSATGDCLLANQQIRDNFFPEAPHEKSPDFPYYAAFSECDGLGPDEIPPYHLVPICAFWALNGRWPHFTFRDDMSRRAQNPPMSWFRVAPPEVFEALLVACVNKGMARAQCSSIADLRSLSAELRPIAQELQDRADLETTFAEDVEYIAHNVKNADSECFKVALASLGCYASLESRLEVFFSYPVRVANGGVQIIRTGDAPQTSNNLLTFIVGQIGQHLFPTWSFGAVPRFRVGGPFVCPSILSPLEGLCPARGVCNGIFPGVSGLPSGRWFQEAMLTKLALNVRQIQTIDTGYNSTEELVAAHAFWDQVIDL